MLTRGAGGGEAAGHGCVQAPGKGKWGRAMAVVALAFAVEAGAVDVEPGDYTALPAGTNLLIGYYQYATRDKLYSNGNQVGINAKLDSHIGIARYVRFVDIGGYIVDPQILVPFGELKAKDDLSALGSTSGVADPILAATVWVINKPKEGEYLGITPFVWVPIGSYDNNKALNLGQNRWQFALQAG